MRDVVALPKAHLHVHLESTVRWSTLAELADANGVAVPGREFTDFFAHNHLVRLCLARPEDFRRIALEYCADEAAQGTRYAEVSFTAAAHGERLGDAEAPLEAVLDGLAAGLSRYQVECRLILDHSRRRSLARAWRSLDLARRYADRGVVAIGAAGDEAYPLEPFADVWAAARAAGVHVVHHAGEAAGAGSVRAALGPGRAERLGHGIRVLDDAALVAEVRDRRVPLEVCPSSNVALGFAPSLAGHPLPRLREAGVVVTLNADIPAQTGAPLATEYARVRDAFGYGDEVLAELARAGVDASFAPPGTKASIRAGIDAWLAGMSDPAPTVSP
jgi:adenosine deaminase